MTGPATLSEMVDGMVEWTENTAETLDPEADWLPAMAIASADGTAGMVLIMGEFLSTPFRKDVLAWLIMPMVLREHAATMWCFRSTAWKLENPITGKTRDESHLNYAAIMEEWDYSIAEHPDRIEIVQIFAGHVTGQMVMMLAPVIRHEDAPPELGEWQRIESVWRDGPDGTELSGRFADACMMAIKDLPSPMEIPIALALAHQFPDVISETIDDLLQKTGYLSEQVREIVESEDEYALLHLLDDIKEHLESLESHERDALHKRISDRVIERIHETMLLKTDNPEDVYDAIRGMS